MNKSPQGKFPHARRVNGEGFAYNVSSNASCFIRWAKNNIITCYKPVSQGSCQRPKALRVLKGKAQFRPEGTAPSKAMDTLFPFK